MPKSGYKGDTNYKSMGGGDGSSLVLVTLGAFI